MMDGGPQSRLLHDLLSLPVSLQVLLGGAAGGLVGLWSHLSRADDVDHPLVLSLPQRGGQGGQVLDHGTAARHSGVDLEMEARRRRLSPGGS